MCKTQIMFTFSDHGARISHGKREKHSSFLYMEDMEEIFLSSKQITHLVFCRSALPAVRT